MRFLNKFDLQSKIIILISLLGIVASLSLFFISYTGLEDVHGAEVIAKVVESNKDIRVKRSGNIHWYPVSDKINCFNNDLIFTGSDSYATIEYSSGDKIYLHPNSLVSVSLNKIALESGTIELDLNKSSPLSIKSFGEEFQVKEKAKFKIIDSNKTKKIVPLNKGMASFNNPEFKKFLQEEDITISSPRPGKLIPKFSGELLNLSWKALQPKDNFKVEFTTSKSKEPILTLNTEETNLNVELSNLPEGMIYWKVLSASGKSKDESSFYLTTDFDIDLTSPLSDTNFKLNENGVVDIVFEWTSSLETKKRIQIARDPGFTKMIYETTSDTSKKSLNFNGEGTFYWRVAHDIKGKPLEWSATSTFIVGDDRVISPIEIKFLAKTIDFSLTEKVSFQIIDPNNCQELVYKISKNGSSVVAQGRVLNNLVELTKVDDGNYTIQVTGKIHNKKATSPAYDFQVKNSKALKAPKLNKKRIKIMVKIFEEILNFIVPSSYAAEEGSVLLDWEDAEGPQSDAAYELEISHNTSRNVVFKQELKDSEYLYQIPTPGLYFWRVRTKLNGIWSPFSEYGQIAAQDEVSLQEAPLMLSPASGSVLKAEEFKKGILFTWREPFKDSSYFLELYNDRTGKLIKKMPVSGGERRIKLKNFKSVSWRVYGVSSFETETPNEQKFKVIAEVPKPLPKPKPVAVAKKAPPSKPEKKTANLRDKIFVRGYMALTKSNYAQTAENSTLSGFAEELDFTGTMLYLQAEYWPRLLQGKHAFTLGYRLISSTPLRDSELSFEYGRVLRSYRTTVHKVYLGLHQNSTTTSTTDFSSEFAVTSLGARYLYQRYINNIFSLDVNTELLKSQLSATIPSIRVRPTLNYRWKKNIWANATLGFERNLLEASHSANGEDGMVEIKVNNIFLGLGLTWMYN